MKHFLDITRDIIKERNLDYSPELFKSILNEVKTRFFAYSNVLFCLGTS